MMFDKKSESKFKRMVRTWCIQKVTEKKKQMDMLKLNEKFR